MFIDTSAGYTYNMNAAKTAGVPLAVAPLPCNVNCASMIQGTNLAIFAPNQSRAQIQAAAKLIEFLLREDNIVYWAQKTGYLPVTRTAIQGQLWQGYIAGKPEQKVMTDQLIAGGFGQLLHPGTWTCGAFSSPTGNSFSKVRAPRRRSSTPWRRRSRP